MAATAQHWVVAATVVLAALAGCGNAQVSMTEVSHEQTQQMQVWAPPQEGPWPVVYAIPGSGGAFARDLDTVAAELAARGVLVIGTDWRTEPFNPTYREMDSECGYRYALEIAEDHGGDLSQPVTILGFSLGATSALTVGLDSSLYGPGGNYNRCFSGTERPGLVLALAGCHLQYLDVVESRADNVETQVVLLSGALDSICPTSLHSATVQEALEGKGFTVSTVEIADADHGGLVFRNTRDWTELPPDDPIGQATVDALLEAIGSGEQAGS